jgi:hypothetical protein
MARLLSLCDRRSACAPAVASPLAAPTLRRRRRAATTSGCWHASRPCASTAPPTPAAADATRGRRGRERCPPSHAGSGYATTPVAGRDGALGLAIASTGQSRSPHGIDCSNARAPLPEQFRSRRSRRCCASSRPARAAAGWLRRQPLPPRTGRRPHGPVLPGEADPRRAPPRRCARPGARWRWRWHRPLDATRPTRRIGRPHRAPRRHRGRASRPARRAPHRPSATPSG